MNLMNNETKQTAVDWLIEQLRRPTANYIPIFEIINKAKEMEKEQMKGMYVEGSFAKMRYYDGFEYIDADQYYNETFGKL
jgi:hypothetical protein